MSFGLSNVMIGDGGVNIKDSGISLSNISGGGSISANAGTFTKNTGDDFDTTETVIAHGLGKTPKQVNFLCQSRSLQNNNTWVYNMTGTGFFCNNIQSSWFCYSEITNGSAAVFYGSNTYAIYIVIAINPPDASTITLSGLVSVDNTNITITWIRVGTGYIIPSTINITWNVIA